MKELKFRNLNANEIEVRIGASTKKTFTLLLYKDARVDMALLDEVVGVGNWQREHKILGNDIYCRVGIWDNDKSCWVWKEDAGSSGSIEVEKSKASDSFKRACVNLGIGRELYTSPEIKIWKQDENDDSYKYNHYFVKEIAYTNNEISKLIICEEKSGEVVFSYPKARNNSQTTEKAQKKDILAEVSKGIGDTFVVESNKITDDTKSKINAFTGKLSADRYQDFKSYMLRVFAVESVGDLTELQGQQLLKALSGK